MRKRPSSLLVLLLGLSILTAALGMWRLWLGRQQLAEQSKPAMTGPSQALAPDFELATLDGGSIRLADLRGKVVLLNFWATWCPPCKAEMPDLDALHRAYGETQGLVVLGVNLQEPVDTVAPFVRDRNLSFPILLDTDGRVTSDLFHVRPLPTTFIIDRQGYIRDAWNGQIAQEAMLARLKNVW
jgi:cytochrome c biogenesis protein CcmG/thiol:disulfide interchange protein DsbE